jgi:membrane protein DedA with SNARE-associated domain
VDQALEFLTRYGYLLLFLWVLVERIGLPLPALPVLLAAGAMARTGRMSLALSVLLALAASLLADIVWYEIGRRRGGQVLKWVCRISLEPDSCVRRTENAFARHGARALLVAKFFPALNVAVPIGGMTGMRYSRFLLYDTAGAVLWVLTFVGLGYLFSRQLERILESATLVGGSLATLLAVALSLYVVWKYLQRRRFIRDLAVERITPEELHRKLARGDDVAIVDLRHASEFRADPTVIEGALHVPLEDLDDRSLDLPAEGDVVLYCT